MVDKSKLKEAAFLLALEEQKGRIAYNYFLKEEIKENELALISENIRNQQNIVEGFRKNIPEVQGKSYWWDIPYEITKPVGEFLGTFAFQNGIYTEQDDFSETFGGYIEKAPMFETSIDVFQSYLSSEKYIPLFVNRKLLKSNLNATVQRKVILCAEEQATFKLDLSSYGDFYITLEEDSADARLRLEQCQMESDYYSDIMNFRSRQDNIERLINSLDGDGPFTHSFLWTSGQMSNDLYYRNELYRDYREMEIRQKAQEKIAAIEYQRYLRHRKKVEAQGAYSRSQTRRMIANYDKGTIMRFMRCGYIFYMEGYLAAVVLMNEPTSIYEIRHHGDVSPYDIFGNIGSCKKTALEIPNPAPVIDFVLQKYKYFMKLYSPLALRPKNASDELWRYWMEQSFAEYVIDCVSH